MGQLSFRSDTSRQRPKRRAGRTEERLPPRGGRGAGLIGCLTATAPPIIGRVIASAEYELLREDAGLVDRSERAKLRLTGAEAAEFLQGQVTNDVETLAPGEGCYAALLNHKGKLRADMRVLRGEDWIWLDAEGPGGRPLVHTVETYSLGRDVRWEDVGEARAILSLVGPGAREGLAATPPQHEHAFVEGEHGLYVTTDLGVDVICDAADTAGVREALAVE